MADSATPRLSRDALADLLDFEAEETPASYDRDTPQMLPKQLEQLLAPERTTANLVVLLDRPKRRRVATPVVVACFVAGVMIGALVTSLSL